MPLHSHTVGGHLTDYRSHIFSAPGVIGFDGALISRCSLDDDIQLYRLSSGVFAVIPLLTNWWPDEQFADIRTEVSLVSKCPTGCCCAGVSQLPVTRACIIIPFIRHLLTAFTVTNKTNTTSVIKPYFTICDFFQI